MVTLLSAQCHLCPMYRPPSAWTVKLLLQTHSWLHFQPWRCAPPYTPQHGTWRSESVRRMARKGERRDAKVVHAGHGLCVNKASDGCPGLKHEPRVLFLEEPSCT